LHFFIPFFSQTQTFSVCILLFRGVIYNQDIDILPIALFPTEVGKNFPEKVILPARKGNGALPIEYNSVKKEGSL
jgi:hypothetical protein